MQELETELQEIAAPRQPPGRADRLRRAILRLLPWAGSILLLWMVFRNLDGERLRAAMQQVDLPLFSGIVLFQMFWVLVMDTLTIRMLFTHGGVDLPMKEALAVRSASYLANAVNFNLGQAAFALYMAVTRGVSLISTISSMLALLIFDLSVVGVLVLLGAHQLPDHFRIPLMIGAFAGVIAAVLLMAIGMFRPSHPAAQRLMNARIMRGFTVFRPLLVLKLVLVRAPLLVGVIFLNWNYLRLFGVEVPFLALMAIVPALMIVSNLPIGVQGIGTVQAAVMVLFAPFGPAETTVTYSLLMQGLLSTFKIIWAAFFVRPVLARAGGWSRLKQMKV
ncbi:MAG: hypothetical protein GMKNLPBB_01197 [Myxococcota bacterium]|nr:hypothetical protein [Myxococcota bacterium]